MEDNKTKEEILREIIAEHGETFTDEQWDEELKANAESDIVFRAMESYSQQSTKQLQDRVVEMTEALKQIAEWKLPETGKFWDDGTPMSYEAAYGTNGSRDYFKSIAINVLNTKS